VHGVNGPIFIIVDLIICSLFVAIFSP